MLDGDPAPACERGTTAPPPLFGPCLLWPRSPISATAELLLGLVGRQRRLAAGLPSGRLWQLIHGMSFNVIDGLTPDFNFLFICFDDGMQDDIIKGI